MKAGYKSPYSLGASFRRLTNDFRTKPKSNRAKPSRRLEKFIVKQFRVFRGYF
jgi:hypothetical protein